MAPRAPCTALAPTAWWTRTGRRPANCRSTCCPRRRGACSCRPTTASIYALDGDPVRTARIAQVPGRQLTRILPRGDRFLVTASNPGKILELAGTAAPTGSYTSEVKDATTGASWGLLRWEGVQPAGSSVAFATRSGNTSTPDETWADWVPVRADEGVQRIASPPARYLQWKVDLSGRSRARSRHAHLLAAQSAAAPDEPHRAPARRGVPAALRHAGAARPRGVSVHDPRAGARPGRCRRDADRHGGARRPEAVPEGLPDVPVGSDRSRQGRPALRSRGASRRCRGVAGSGPRTGGDRLRVGYVTAARRPVHGACDRSRQPRQSGSDGAAGRARERADDDRQHAADGAGQRGDRTSAPAPTSRSRSPTQRRLSIESTSSSAMGSGDRCSRWTARSTDLRERFSIPLAALGDGPVVLRATDSLGNLATLEVRAQKARK